MKQIHIQNSVIFFWFFTFCAFAHAGGVVGMTAPIDVEAMEDYALQDYAEPPSERDPFTTSDKMFRASGQQGANRAGGQGFVPFLSNNALPRMRVRGFVHNGPNDAMALLQIDGDDTVHLVRKGDEIGIQSRSGQPNAVLKVLKVDLKKVEVQSGSLRQVIIVQ
jgi:Tfp pilus assembly protein PilP